MATTNSATPNTATPKRSRLKSGVATEFTIYSNVLAGHERAIREAFKQARHDLRRAEAVKQIGSIHKARWVLFDDDRWLMFASSFDGDWDKYLNDFSGAYVATIFDKILSHCEGYPGLQDPHIKDWFMYHAWEAVGYSSAYPEATVRDMVKDIWRALALEKAFA